MRRQNNESSDRGSVTATCTFLVDETHFPGTARKIVPQIRAMHGPNHLTVVHSLRAPAQSYVWSTPKSQSPILPCLPGTCLICLGNPICLSDASDLSAAPGRPLRSC